MIVLLNGFHGSGKDTLGLHLTSKCQFVGLSFAKKVKDLAADRYQFNRQWADDPAEKDRSRDDGPFKGGFSVRDLCRRVWMEFYASDKTKFARMIVETIAANPDHNYVITDFRYDHEYVILAENFGRGALYTVHLQRKAVPLPDRLREPEEYMLEEFRFDSYLDNNQTIEALHRTFQFYLILRQYHSPNPNADDAAKLDKMWTASNVSYEPFSSRYYWKL